MQNPENGSVSRLITDLKNGDHEAARQIWQRYYENIVRLARSRMREVPRAMADEEDAALSILNSFFCGAAAGRFPILENREDLWRILMTITTRKAIKLAQYEGRLKRGGRKVLDEARMVAASMESNGALDQIPSREPSPEMAALVVDECQRLFDVLPDESLRMVAQFRLDGYTDAEIAKSMNCGLSTIERRVRTIRKVWANEVEELAK